MALLRKPILAGLGIIFICCALFSNPGSAVSIVSATKDNVFTKLIENSDHCLIDCYAIFEVCVPDVTLYATQYENVSLGFTYYLPNGSTRFVESERVEILKNISVSKFIDTWGTCHDSGSADGNNTAFDTGEYSCITGKEQVVLQKERYVPLNLTGLLDEGCYKVKLNSKKKFDENIDWVPSISLTTKNDMNLILTQDKWAWWNSTWQNRIPIEFHNSLSFDAIDTKLIFNHTVTNTTQARYTIYNATSDTETETEFMFEYDYGSGNWRTIANISLIPNSTNNHWGVGAGNITLYYYFNTSATVIEANESLYDNLSAYDTTTCTGCTCTTSEADTRMSYSSCQRKEDTAYWGKSLAGNGKHFYWRAHFVVTSQNSDPSESWAGMWDAVQQVSTSGGVAVNMTGQKDRQQTTYWTTQGSGIPSAVRISTADDTYVQWWSNGTNINKTEYDSNFVSTVSGRSQDLLWSQHSWFSSGTHKPDYMYVYSNTYGTGTNQQSTGYVEDVLYIQDWTDATYVVGASEVDSDSTPPVVKQVETDVGVINSLSDSIVLSANATDNVAIDSVRFNVSIPGGSPTMCVASNVSADNWTCSFSSYVNEGIYNFTVIANDTTNNLNNTETGSFTLALLPNVTSAGVNSTTPSQLDPIRIYVDAVDDTAIDSVYVNVTLPNLTTIQTFMLLSNLTQQWNPAIASNQFIDGEYEDSGNGQYGADAPFIYGSNNIADSDEVYGTSIYTFDTYGSGYHWTIGNYSTDPNSITVRMNLSYTLNILINETDSTGTATGNITIYGYNWDTSAYELIESVQRTAGASGISSVTWAGYDTDYTTGYFWATLNKSFIDPNGVVRLNYSMWGTNTGNDGNGVALWLRRHDNGADVENKTHRFTYYRSLYYDLSFTDTHRIGTYTLDFFANDTYGNVNATESTTFTVQDTEAPNVSNFDSNVSSLNQTHSVLLYTNVTDDPGSAISVVLFEVTFPNSTAKNHTGINTTSEEFNYSFSETTQVGTYSVKVIANDTSNNINNTETFTFSVNDSSNYQLFDGWENLLVEVGNHTSNSSEIELNLTNSGTYANPTEVYLHTQNQQDYAFLFENFEGNTSAITLDTKTDSGHYPGAQSFYYDTINSTDTAYWLEAGGSDITVVNEFMGHKNVLRMENDDNAFQSVIWQSDPHGYNQD